MDPPGISINQSQSLSEVAKILQEPKHDRTLAMSREFREAQAHRQRENGSMGLFLDSKKNLDYVSPRACMRRPASIMSQPSDEERPGVVVGGPGREGAPGLLMGEGVRQPRLHGTASLENQRRSRNGEMAQLLMTMQAENMSQADKPRPRVTSEEAEENFHKHRVGTMKDLLNVEANRTYNDPKPRGHNLTTEAKENQEKHTGSTMAGLLTQSKPGTTFGSETDCQFSEQTKKNRPPDTCFKVIKGELPGDPVPEARVKYSGKEIYDKHRGTLTTLIADYGRTAPDLDRPHMKRYDDRRMEGAMKSVIEEYGKPLPKSSSSYRVRTPDARRFAKTSAGSSMSSYFSDTKPYKANSLHKWPN